MGPQGPAGANGINGINCWDPNGNGVPDIATEDLNSDMVVDVLDCRGPPGTGTLMALGSSATETTLGTACTNYAGAEVSIVVPTNGTIVVQAQVWLLIGHTVGTEDIWLVSVGNSPTDCGTNVWRWLDTVPASIPSEPNMDRTAFVQRAFAVGPGMYTYYINGFMVSGQSVGDLFWYANLVAVFYPA